jgi:uncharacterized membrane protein
MSLTKDIAELLNAKVINQETADNIKIYYKNKGGQSNNRLFVIFGVLGAILVGLGIILIIAHNWDELSRSIKTFFAFLPLVSGQLFCAYALLKKKDSIAWREGSSSFLIFAVGACISLVSQIYNIPGDLASFLFTWILLSLPLIYIMRSSMASVLYLIGITFYASEVSYMSSSTESYTYWLLLLGALPHYYLLYKKNPTSNFLFFHNWMIPLSVIIILGTVADNNEILMFNAYIYLFGLLYIIGNLDFFKQQRTRNNAYMILGSLGTIILLLIMSFDWFWEEVLYENFILKDIIDSAEFISSAIISLLALGVLILKLKNRSFNEIKPIELVFILFTIIFIIGMYSLIAMILINLLVFAIGILTIKNGAKKDHLGILNFGLLTITALVVCRFFDENLSFVIRGLLFVSVGIGFFATNYWLIKKRKINE